MGFTILLQDAKGQAESGSVHDPKSLLNNLLPTVEDGVFHYLPFIDFYGDTIFSGRQMDPFRREWRALLDSAHLSEERALIDAVDQLAARCADEVHLYLRFVGD